MAGLKDIKRRIKSVKNTKKITYAMKLVSAAKLKKAQDAVTAAREYTNALNQLLAELIQEQQGGDFSHPLMSPHQTVKKVRFLIVGGSRGLCGGYNSNINKRTELAFREIEERHPGVEISSVLLGRKVGEHFRRTGRPYIESHEELPDNANQWPVEDICSNLENAYLENEADEVYLIFTRFKSAMSQSVEFQKILPMEASDLGVDTLDAADSSGGNTRFEPSVEAVYSAVIPRILRVRVRQGGLDAKASEQGSRMVAMDSATTNAGELVDRLTLAHNKLRQGAITAELLDIVGGADAQEG